MMSESSDALDLEFFLTSWLRDGAPRTIQISVGYANNLLDAVSWAFNFNSFEQYNNKCFKYLSNEVNESPLTIIQVDIMTLIKVIIQWPCYQSLSKSVQDFYLWSIMHLSTVQDMNAFREVAIKIIQKMSAEYSHLMDGKNGLRSSLYYDPNRNKKFFGADHNYINDCRKEAYNLCHIVTEFEGPANDTYYPMIIENLVQLFSEFPSWTQVMPQNIECSMLVSGNARQHLDIFPRWMNRADLSKFLEHHTHKLRAMNQIIEAKMNKKNERSDNVPSQPEFAPQRNLFESEASMITTTAISERISQSDINVIAKSTSEMDLESLENTTVSVIYLLSDFNGYIQETLEHMKAGEETSICRTLLKCLEKTTKMITFWESWLR
ncbi:hypothetical protein QAD02_013874 [Eretmocerus hayati]|uniref:Uncharacterized protein n=1 Tax=Eretmocerus hayati TaxID=131215 RepID=A0ACC2P6I7_9HYME|nr:hypothetical protein QAD02_013874 [Eretmocerus hayati]